MGKKKSVKPAKQRKRLFARPLHQRKRELKAHLSRELRKQLGKRALMVRKNDRVEVMRGKHSNFKGRVARVEHKKARVFIEKLSRKKADGTEVLIPLVASNLLITELHGDDERRHAGKKKGEWVEKKGKRKGAGGEG